MNKVKVERMADEVKAGDDSLNKLKVQNLDFILDIPLKVRRTGQNGSFSNRGFNRCQNGSHISLLYDTTTLLLYPATFV